MRLQPTLVHPLTEHYSRAGGPWGGPGLEELFGNGRRTGTILVDGPVELDHAQLEGMVGALAGGLRQHGVERGDAVAWQLPNCYQAVVLYRACWRLGAIPVPLHHRLGAADVAPVIELAEPKTLLCAPDLALAEFEPAVVVGGRSEGFGELMTSAIVPPAPVKGEEIALGMLTSGSTGPPKIVLHSFRALAYKAPVQQQVHGLTSEDVVLMPAPLSHVSGLLNGVLLPGASGMKAVLMETWDPEHALELMEEHRVSYMGGPAVFLLSLVESPRFDPSRVRSLRVCSMGGSTMTPAALLELAERLGCTVKRTYGSTEAPTITTMHAGDPEVKGRETDGRPIGEAEVIVVDPTTGARRAVGDVGEIWLRGPEMFVGYALPAQTADAVTVDGWLRTGDLGLLDAQGWLTVAGRIKELIIRGGENIASAEVEAILESHPSVRQAVAVGYPDRILGERVAAAVVADESFDLDVCRQLFRQHGVAKFKTPEAVIHLGSVPMTATGKADRAKLKQYVATVLKVGSERGDGGPERWT